MRRRFLARQEIVRSTRVLATRVLATIVHETSLQLRLCTRESRDPRHRGLSVSNGEARTLGTTKFFELLDAFVASLQPRETLHQSSDLAALLQQFAFHSLMIFHVFSQFLDLVALFHGALARDSFTHIAIS